MPLCKIWDRIPSIFSLMLSFLPPLTSSFLRQWWKAERHRSRQGSYHSRVLVLGPASGTILCGNDRQVGGSRLFSSRGRWWTSAVAVQHGWATAATHLSTWGRSSSQVSRACMCCSPQKSISPLSCTCVWSLCFRPAANRLISIAIFAQVQFRPMYVSPSSIL